LFGFLRITIELFLQRHDASPVRGYRDEIIAPYGSKVRHGYDAFRGAQRGIDFSNC